MNLLRLKSRLAEGRLASAKSPVGSPVTGCGRDLCLWAGAMEPVNMRVMAGWGPQQMPVGLPGREQECAAIDRLLADARAGAGGALVVRGEPGIGKSALLGYAREHAGPMLVLSAVGVEAESDLAFAGLHELLRPVLMYLGDLPDTQSEALAGALGLAPSAQADRLLISAAVLSLLAAAAETQPLLCVVDDAQWVDRPSADALVFTARRLRAEHLAILFGVRDSEARRVEAGLAELALTGLCRDAAVEVLATMGRAAAPSVCERLLAEADGNPLALLELPASLSEAQLSGRVPLPDAIPLTPRLEGVFRQRIGRLPRRTQTALLIAAADNTGDAPAVLRAAATLELPAAALDPAEGSGLIRITGKTITFRHPLVRSALYQGATLSQRQQAHAALASALRGDDNADRRVWHQAMATLTADEEVAAALEASARRAELRAGHSSAATAYLRAAELSTDEGRRARRIAAAAHAAWDAGQPDRAREIIGRALPLATGQTRARLLHLSGVIEAHTGSVQEAFALLVDAADASTDPSLTIEMLFEAADAAQFSGDPAAVVKLGQRAMRISAVDESDRFKIAALGGFARSYAGDHDQAQALITGALHRANTVTDPRVLMWAADAASASKGLGAGLPYASRAVDQARRNGLVGLLPLVLRRQAMELLWLSQFDLAYAAAQEGYRLSVDLGYGSSGHLVNMAAAEAAWGHEQDARRHIEEALTLSQRRGSLFPAIGAEWTLGLIELAAGRPAEAAERLLAITSSGDPHHNPLIALEVMPDAVEAGVRAGQREQAATRLDSLRRRVAAAPTAGRRALLARCEALLGERDPVEAFGEAIVLGSGLPPMQRARTELLYGEWLRRERRRTDARVHLRAALEAFRRLGAVPWAERAEAELRATGETARRRHPSAVEQLTAQELQIARLVTEGLTNREIAAQLFLSPRTIDYHLRKVFTRLGIASRAELVRDGLPQPGPA
jgi:DNA-binding CsgD family transcriptional regulator